MPAAGEVTFTSSSGRPMRAALALPDAAGPRPGVIVIHEIFGLNDDIRRIAGRVADLGYVALAPDLFDTDGPRPICVLRTFIALRRRQGQAFADLDAARAWLGARTDVDPDRVAAVGFCLGGGFALFYALKAPLRATGVFYGETPATAEELRGICPVLGGYGGRDRIFAPQGARLAQHLEALDVPHDVKTYPDAGHSYMSSHTGLAATLGAWGPMAVGFDPAAAADSWTRLAAFFRTHLGT
jgi:carboxymethylenebutenolidase